MNFNYQRRPPASEYLPEIDGLRTVAIVSVVAFHVGVPFFAGGYVGVDIFFVISGFLITRLLFRELSETGTIDIVEFYARRVRRLLPALSLVLIVTLGAGALFLTPIGEQQDLSASSVATSAFAANFYFWRTQTGYFAGPADQIPLLHMWTLAVEEQFYIVWPVTMLLVASLARRQKGSLKKWLTVMLVIGSLASFLACWAMTSVKPTMTFYLTPFRAWEFGVGGLLAFLVAGQNGPFERPRLGSVATIIGYIAIATSVVVLDSHTQFPGAAALLPVLGTAAVIFGILLAPGSRVASLMRFSVVVWIGKWSYSWYLWHWPLLAIARSSALGDHSLLTDLTLAIFALLLSAMTYVWVEEPIRRRKLWPFMERNTTALTGLLMLILTAGAAGAVRFTADSRVDKSTILSAAFAAKQQNFSYSAQCTHFKLPFAGLAPIDDCMIGSATDQPVIVLWGDSHANHFLPALAQYVESRKARLLPRVMGGCLPAVLATPDNVSVIHRIEAKSCAEFNEAVVRSLPELKAKGARIVVIAGRWSLSEFWNSNQDNGYERLAHVIGLIQSNGLDVVIVDDTPGYSVSIPECVVRRGATACSRSRADVDNERASSSRILKRAAGEFKGVRLWDPLPQLCDRDSCPAVHNGVVLYTDSHHLSFQASRELLSDMAIVLDEVVHRWR